MLMTARMFTSVSLAVVIPHMTGLSTKMVSLQVEKKDLRDMYYMVLLVWQLQDMLVVVRTMSLLRL